MAITLIPPQEKRKVTVIESGKYPFTLVSIKEFQKLNKFKNETETRIRFTFGKMLDDGSVAYVSTSTTRKTGKASGPNGKTAALRLLAPKLDTSLAKEDVWTPDNMPIIAEKLEACLGNVYNLMIGVETGQDGNQYNKLLSIEGKVGVDAEFIERKKNKESTAMTPTSNSAQVSKLKTDDLDDL